SGAAARKLAAAESINGTRAGSPAGGSRRSAPRSLDFARLAQPSKPYAPGSRAPRKHNLGAESSTWPAECVRLFAKAAFFRYIG
ncbi:MAG: hypothetical protein J2P13_09530, partial [Acidobacteria bacterium]|nr:hypothetical protein [Acidobacteriota bacterium]